MISFFIIREVVLSFVCIDLIGVNSATGTTRVLYVLLQVLVLEVKLVRVEPTV